ncbi:ParB/RepB/Spo0J family partition protein [Streptomyces sp. NPDC020898]|uniref:ParB/RepB/Spo0J family partition protein n=1 Tax=Streptomyces sp. NPDC020898 TaxID=3365101 RepID=UPI00379EFEE8
MSSAGRTGDPASEGLAHVAECRQMVEQSPVVTVAVAALAAADSPRVAGEDSEYVRTLAESEDAFPPITVHHDSMRVIDGMHRLRAAKLRGWTEIAVRFFDGERADAFVLSVAANTSHGLPLSRADRLAAASRILGFRPEWSDRAIATVSGLAAKKVAEIRRNDPGEGGTSAVRVGIDGRARPVNCVRGRELAGELIRADPGASLRQIAKAAGISPATVADVRDRLRQGHDPVPTKLRTRTTHQHPQNQASGEGAVPLRRSRPFSELLPTFETLCKDPSLRFSETGRLVLRLFDSCAAATKERTRILDSLPAHCREPVAELLLSYAEIWQGIAVQLGEDNGVSSRQAI